MSARTQISGAVEKEEEVERILKEITVAEKKGDWDKAEALYAKVEEVEAEAFSAEEKGANIMPVYLSVSNPKVIDMKNSVDVDVLLDGIAEAKQSGNDGIKLINIYDPVTLDQKKEVTTQWIAFETNQIKSINNKGAFSEDGNILKTSLLVTTGAIAATQAKQKEEKVD